MPLLSSYGDCGGVLRVGRRQRSVPPSLSAAAGAPTRSSVQRIGRDSTSIHRGHSPAAHDLRPASPEATEDVSRVVLGTASLVLHRDQSPSKLLPITLPQSLPERRTTTTSPPHHGQEEQFHAPSTDGRSSAKASRHQCRSAQPLPSHLNPSFLAAVSSKTPRVSLSRGAAGMRATSIHSSLSVLSPQRPAPSTSPRLAHLRPLSTSREADYLNLAYQRGFMGRFRCAIPVMVHTSAAATPHTHALKSSDLCTTMGAAGQRKDETMASSGGHVDASQLSVNASMAAAAETSTRSAGEAHVDDVNNACASATDTADEAAVPHADMPERHTRAGASLSATSAAALPGSAMLLRPRLSIGGSAASVVSGSTTRRGRASGRVSRRLPTFATASVTASSLPRPSVRTTSRLTGLRKCSTGGLLAGTAVGGGGKGVSAANMERLANSGLHTTLWMAVHDGGIEVRSMANPNQVLAGVRRKDPRTVITALAEVCGNRVVAGHTDGSLHIFDAITLKEVGEQQPHTAAITRLLYVESAPRALALADSDGHAAVSHTKSGQLQTCSLLLTASVDRTITVWEAATMTLMHRLKGSARGVCALAATATGGYAFSGSDEGTIRMWDVAQGQQCGITRDERVQLGRCSRENAPVWGSAVAESPSTRFTEATKLSSSANDAGDVESKSSDGREGPQSRYSFPASTSPRINYGTQRQLQPQHLRAPQVTRPRNVNGGGTPSHPTAPNGGASHHQSLLSYGGVQIVPRTRGTLGRGTLALRESRTSSRSLPATEDSFAPMDTATSFSPFRERDGLLTGPGGSISPLRIALDYETERAEMESGDDLSSGAALHAGPPDHRCDAPVSTRRHQSAKKTRKTNDGYAGTTTASTGDVGERKHKHKASSSGRCKKAKKATKGSASITTPAVTAKAVRSPASVLEQRLETWIRLYHKRVQLSAASHQLSTRFAASYDVAAAMNWPIECAHVEYITALTVVEDRLLVSGSCDATAKVFALPSGQYLRTLTSSRRMPLSGVLYDSQVGRIYTGFSDGAVSVYDLTSSELPLLSQLQSPQSILSCTFAPLAMAPMQRFVIHTRIEADKYGKVVDVEHQDTAVVTTIAQFDKTTQAHGPNQTTSSYRVGQPSLRELNAAVSLQPLQRQRVANLTAQSQRGANGKLEEKELHHKRQCGLVLAQAHRRRQTELIFWRWQRWALRRVALREFSSLAETRARSLAHLLLGRYMLRWVSATRQRKNTKASAVLRTVQLKGSDATLLSVPMEVRSGLRCALDRMATTMVRSLNQLMLRRIYRRWREFQRIRHAEIRQSVCFNRLLLSMNASADAPGCYTLDRLTRVATRRAHHAKALWLVVESTARWQSQRQRRHFFARWRAFALQRQRMQERQEEEAGWRLVEPLSSTLVQPRLLRRHCFEAWRNFALYLARSDQLSERETLQREWAALQKALETPTTVAELKTKALQAEAQIAQIASERATLIERVQVLADEDSALRTEEALRVLIAGYYVPDAATTAATTGATTPRAYAGAARMALNARRTSMASSVESGTTCGASRAPVKSCSSDTASTSNAEDALAFWKEEQRSKKLLLEVSAVLRALKGNCMQCARDDKLLANAHALSLRLPIYEHLTNEFLASTESSPSCRSGKQQQPCQRSTVTWSVCSAKNGASTAGPAHLSAALPVSLSSTQQQRHPQRRRYLALSGSLSSGESAANVTGASTPRAAAAAGSNSNNAIRTSAAAQMWAAQPAEEQYLSLADAFNTVYANLLELLRSAAWECGVDASATCRSASANVEDRIKRSTVATAGAALPSTSERRRVTQGETEGEGEHTLGELQAPAVTPSWLAQVPLKQRRTMVGEVLKLVTLFDSFAAHSDLPVERTGSISTRGAANTRALPLSSLCSHETAQSLLRYAAVLLEMVDPLLWPRQLKLNYLQDAYAAAIAELNATVSSSHASDARLHASPLMTRSESEERAVSPQLAPLVLRMPTLCLSAEVLQRAADKLQPAPHTPVRRTPSSQQLDLHASPTTTNNDSDRQSARSSAVPKFSTAGTVGAAPRLTLLRSNLESPMAGCGDGNRDKLNGRNKSIEEGQTSVSDPHLAQSNAFSHHTFSAVSTPRSYTSRTAISPMAGASTGLLKPYLGFRVNVARDSHTPRRTTTTITIRDVAAQYVNADGVEVDSPALVAGVQAGDQLIRFAGYAVTDLAAFNAVVARHVHSGAELPVVLQRGEELLRTTIVVGTRVA
ncbi:hypothetical protein ABL78_0813 [Leptomonas seymouri]|uniref:Uncharacterized protein n=1 Tax=Leptomonas seymouri TaxID=5684 RepID=A0A0N1I9R3_LEPSE|nr:hypothetical protein ABL78_0813 [Leptomonas seymouri]|eukprot:KPI90060.1 hypothetical protein ABL78_0813 [Leptomonas seymouri]